MGRKYSFRPGTRIKGVKPEEAVRELEKIRDQGALTPQAVVEVATDPASPIHDAFEWDDTAAAKEHRLSQARMLIRAVVVQYDDTRVPENVFVHVRVEEVQQYERVEVVVRSQTLLDSALDQLRGKLKASEKAVLGLIQAAREANDPNAAKTASAVANHLAEASKAAEEVTVTPLEPPQA